MSELQPYYAGEVRFDPSFMEEILLQIADTYRIEIAWDRNTAVLTGALALAGTFLGWYMGRRVSAALVGGIGGATGLVVSTAVSLREIWHTIKDKLKELLNIIFMYLRRLDPSDLIRAADVLMESSASQRELVHSIISFIAEKLERQVLSTLTAT